MQADISNRLARSMMYSTGSCRDKASELERVKLGLAGTSVLVNVACLLWVMLACVCVCRESVSYIMNKGNACFLSLILLNMLIFKGVVELGDLGLEQRDDLGALEVLGSIEGCLAIGISISRVSTSRQQSIHTLKVALLGGSDQW